MAGGFYLGAYHLLGFDTVVCVSYEKLSYITNTKLSNPTEYGFNRKPIKGLGLPCLVLTYNMCLGMYKRMVKIEQFNK